MSSDESPTKGTRAWRFSLRTMLLLVAILCLAIPLILQSFRLRHAETELRELRDQLGYLSVDDRSKVHVIAVDVNEPDTWRWRMFLPQGVRYSWCLGYGDIPAKGVPKARIGSTSGEAYSETDSEVVINAKLRKTDDGNWSLSVWSDVAGKRDKMGDAMVKIPDSEMRWMSVREGHTLGSRGTESLDPNGPIVLLRWRDAKERAGGTNQPSADLRPGYMIWLEKE